MVDRSIVLVLLLSAGFAVDAGQLATVLHATQLRDAPYTDAAVLATLQPRSSLMVQDRKGGWYEAGFGEHEGWVRMTALRFVQPAEGRPDRSGEEGAAAFNFLMTGRSGYTGITAATGIRGLDSADVMNAHPDHRAVDELEQFRAEERKLRRFAADGGLKSRKVAYLEKKGGMQRLRKFFNFGKQPEEPKQEGGLPGFFGGD
ncbi:MAG: hypothetical protein ABW078_01810 [Sedimenticola sp.]